MSEPSMPDAVPSPSSSPVEVPALTGRSVRWRRVGAGCLAVGVLALAGCGGSGGDATDTASQGVVSASAASASASPAYEPATAERPARNVPKPVMPEGANANSLAGARKFMQYFEDAMNYMIQTGDASYLKEAMTKGSTYFSGPIEEYPKLYKKGEWSIDTKVKFKYVDSAYHVSETGRSYVTAIFTRSDGVIYSKDGIVGEVDGTGRDQTQRKFVMEYVSGAWKFYSTEAVG